jgi:hypothetical protein
MAKRTADIGCSIVSLLTLRLLACYQLLTRLEFTALPVAAVYDRSLEFIRDSAGLQI